jgi:hypothetical protein
MKTLLIIATCIGVALGSAAFAADIGNLAWNQSNVDTLLSFDRAAILKFINRDDEGTPSAMKPQELWEFGWYDLAGDGNYELVVRSSSGPCCVWLGIYSQDAALHVNDQNLRNAGPLKDTVRDLNGDGKKELILWQELLHPGGWIPAMQTPEWPAVYRLKGGKYVEDSRDFPNYYDREVLPQLDKQIANLKQKAAANPSAPGFPASLAIAQMEKYKILRVLGRNPAAGLRHAYRWMKSDDPTQMQCAMAIFQDIGGFPKQVHDLQQALPAALNREIAASKGRRPVQPAPRSAAQPPNPGPPSTTAPPPRLPLGALPATENMR